MSARKELGKGTIAWMAKNPVAANLLMWICVAGGLFMATQAKQEVFPEFARGQIRIDVPYPGASPEEVEQGIVLAIEQAVEGLDGVKKISAGASEGRATVIAELLADADEDQVLNDVKAAVDRVRTLPEEAERPVVSSVSSRRQVISVMVHGHVGEEILRQTAERVREGLIGETVITQAELSGVRAREIAIEIPEATLRAHRLTLDQVARVVRAASVELPGGAIKTRAGELLVRTTERRDLGTEFGELVVVSRPDGTLVRLRDIGVVVDGFAETEREAVYDGAAAVQIKIFRIGDQTPVEIADAARDYLATQAFPPGISADTWNDQSEIFKDRVDLLLRNAGMGLALVLIILGLFLELRLAFWVAVGIPIAFMGSFILVPLFGVSINMISLFAFIVVLGLVVDDAIVVGENVYEMRLRGMSSAEAAIKGAGQMAAPVGFAVATTIAAFSPLLFVPGTMGKIFKVIPLVVIAVLILSLVESLWVLPAHLAHLKDAGEGNVLFRFIDRQQSKVARLLQRFIEGVYVPLAGVFTHHRYTTAAAALAIFALSIASVRAGFVSFTFFPKLESDIITASVRLPVGANVRDTRGLQQRLMKSVESVIEEQGGRDGLVRGIYAQVGEGLPRGGPNGGAGAVGSHITEVQVRLVPSGDRSVSAREIADAWRAKMGRPPGVETMTFKFAGGPSAGSPINVELSHADTRVLDRAAQDLAKRLAGYGSAGVRDIDNGVSNGKPQIDARLRPLGRALGLTETDLARQLRASFYGSEALRQQRGRDEVKVIVRLPRRDRETQLTLERLILRTPSGGEVPFSQAAHAVPGFAKTSIGRVDGRRVLSVSADVDETKGNANDILGEVTEDDLPALLAAHPGLTYSLEGARREQRESMSSLARNFMAAIVVIFGLLAVPFRSYTQPLLVMLVIPFGFVGALMGHALLGYDLSIISMMGIIALAGVVVNDSLILIIATNELRDSGMDPKQAVIQGGARRFRPIMLTSLTTFFGLAPMIFETSMQARFLVPMAISLGFGVLFATTIVLVLVPSAYLILEDLKALWYGPTEVVELEEAHELA